MQILQVQSEDKKTECYEFAQNIIERIESTLEFSTLSSSVSKRTPFELPHKMLKIRCVEIMTAFYAPGKNGILGPYFFEDDDDHRVRGNADRYI